MTTNYLIEKSESYLQRLCVEIHSRRVGSEGNRLATDFFADKISSFGFDTLTPMFDCIDWETEGSQLEIEGKSFEVFPSPYSLGCQVTSHLTVVSTTEELEKVEFSGKILLLKGEIAKEQLMPKNFPFYNPEHHQHILQSLEWKKPQAIIAATSRDVVMVGSQYPFPLIEDGDFDIPNVYMTEEEGNRLAVHSGRMATLSSVADRIPSKGCNVIASKGTDAKRRVVLFAHIDSRMGTPGANDNASGVIVMLLLAELLVDYSGDLGIELVAMNGEDYFSSPGEKQYLELNQGKFDEILLGINLDDVAYYKGKAAYSLYDCPSEIGNIIRDAFSNYNDLMEGEPWYQGDHGLFLMNNIPALAITSELLTELMAEITHTPKDSSEIVDSAKMVSIAKALRDLLLQLSSR